MTSANTTQMAPAYRSQCIPVLKLGQLLGQLGTQALLSSGITAVNTWPSVKTSSRRPAENQWQLQKEKAKIPWAFLWTCQGCSTVQILHVSHLRIYLLVLSIRLANPQAEACVGSTNVPSDHRQRLVFPMWSRVVMVTFRHCEKNGGSALVSQELLLRWQRSR